MKREISRNPQLPIINKDVIHLLTELCFQEDEISIVDLIFVFGTNRSHDLLAKKIEFLLSKKYSNEIIITGGVANYQDTISENIPESDIILNLIDKNRFSDVSFLVERTSKNNLENVINADELFSLSRRKSVICLSHSYASRRSIQTLKKVFKGLLYSYPYDILSEQENKFISKNNWWETEAGRTLVWGEFLRCKTYGGRGDIELSHHLWNLISEIENLLPQ